jgi:hypothetical protein
MFIDTGTYFLSQSGLRNLFNFPLFIDVLKKSARLWYKKYLILQFLQYKILVRTPYGKFKRRLKVSFSVTGRRNVDWIIPDLDMYSTIGCVNLVISIQPP